MDGWNHNSHYHDRLLQSVPRDSDRALDVGCGTGAFARRIAPLAKRVDAIDRDATVIRQARALSASLPNLHFIEDDFINWRAPDRYDVVSMVAALHHFPIRDGLAKAVELLRPNGVLLVLGLDRAPSLAHAGARSLIAYPVSRFYRATRAVSPVTAPIAEPTLTLAEIRQHVNALLPSAIVRRHVLWRYSVIWKKT